MIDGNSLKMRLWQHKRGDRYVPLAWYPQGEPGNYFHEVVWAGEPTSYRAHAMSRGLKALGHDDFNIAVVRKGVVIAMLWDSEWLEYDDDELGCVQDALISHRGSAGLEGNKQP